MNGKRYFVTDAWVGVGGHLHRYEVTGPEGFVSLHKTLGAAMAKAEAMESATETPERHTLVRQGWDEAK